jgi:hypothetical protein
MGLLNEKQSIVYLIDTHSLSLAHLNSLSQIADMLNNSLLRVVIFFTHEASKDNNFLTFLYYCLILVTINALPRWLTFSYHINLLE